MTVVAREASGRSVLRRAGTGEKRRRHRDGPADREAIDAIDVRKLTAHDAKTFLLHGGVTGSGKTEVYLRADRVDASDWGAARSCWCRRSL